MRLILAWVVGILIVASSSYLLDWMGSLMQIKSYIDDFEGGFSTNYGFASTFFSILVGGRIGICINRGTIKAGYSRKDNIEFLAWFFGSLVLVIISAITQLVYKSYYGEIASIIQWAIDAVLFVGVFFIFKWWYEKKIRKLK